MVWASATAGQLDLHLFVLVTKVAAQCKDDFSALDFANMAWVFATVGRSDAQVFAVWPGAVEWYSFHICMWGCGVQKTPPPLDPGGFVWSAPGCGNQKPPSLGGGFACTAKLCLIVYVCVCNCV